MSFNIQHCENYLTKKIDFDKFVEEIRMRKADIIGLNEVRDAGEMPEYQAQAGILAEKLGFHYYFARAIGTEGKDPYGNAILSRFPIVSAETILIPDPVKPAYEGYYETRCVLKARIDVGEGLDVLVTHFGLNPDEQENAVRTVLEHIGDTRCVLMGDFNISPDNSLHALIRERMFDTAGLFLEELLSWPSDHPTMKIDYVYTSADIKVLSADIPADVVSDHRPYVVSIA